jgi:DNA replication protein DnaC
MEVLESYLKTLGLPTVRRCHAEVADQATREGLSYAEFLREVLARECEVRGQNRIERLLHESRLPLEKSLESLDLSRLPLRVRQQLAALRDGKFLDRRENVLVFGNPGSGKTHLLCGLSQALIRRGYRVYYRPCTLLVQELLLAKKELALPRLLKRLGGYQALFLDDLGYVQQSREEMEVLFRGCASIRLRLPLRCFSDARSTARGGSAWRLPPVVTPLPHARAARIGSIRRGSAPGARELAV